MKKQGKRSWYWKTNPERTLLLSDMSGYRIRRKVTLGRPKLESAQPLEGADTIYARREAGEAFGWWGNQTPEQQAQTIARIRQEGVKFMERQNCAERRNRKELP